MAPPTPTRPFTDTPRFKVMRAVVGAANPFIRRLLVSRFAGPQAKPDAASVPGPQERKIAHNAGRIRPRGGPGRQVATTADAMAMQPAADGSIVIAGHEVFTASRDGGQTWQPIAADLPSLDIHGFTRDPIDPVRRCAYLATGGLWESTDAGTHWTRVRDDNVLFPIAVRRH